VYVDEKIHDEFVEKAVDMSKDVQVGDPFDANTFQGA
jgi:acyl-CoA reductase-like NAD-dependent aldehyde dehydrogenase